MNAKKDNKNETIKEIKERFVRKDIKKLDDRNRINIGTDIVKKIKNLFKKVDSFEVFLGEDGDILLRPSANIPSKELWLYQNPKALDMVRKGLKEAKEGDVIQVDDVDEYLEDL
ncbi:MAG: hypothetical protein ACOC56_03665 [Atribacterota bacterium]